MIRCFAFKKSNDIHVITLAKNCCKFDGFQVAFSSATIVVARNQMQPVGIYALFWFTVWPTTEVQGSRLERQGYCWCVGSKSLALVKEKGNNVATSCRLSWHRVC